MKQQVRDRLERYTDIKPMMLEDVITQLDRLGLFDKLEDEESYTSETVDELREESYQDGRRVGVGDAINILRDFDSDGVLTVTLRNLQAKIIDGKC